MLAQSREATYLLTNDKPTTLLTLQVRPAEVETRLNRFLVAAEDEGRKVLLHLTNTGRLHDLIYRGASILYVPKPSAKTDGYLAGVKVGDLAAVIDTKLQAKCFEEAFKRRLIPWLSKYLQYKKETYYMRRRFDYLLESDTEKAFLELKSAAYLSPDGAAMYPDTVSIRGREHVKKLAEISTSSKAYLVFVAAHPGARCFTPCDEGDPQMRPLLKIAKEKGVVVRAFKIHMSLEGDVYLGDPDLPVVL